MFDPMIYEANGSSSACRRRWARQVETSTPPHKPAEPKSGGEEEESRITSNHLTNHSVRRNARLPAFHQSLEATTNSHL